MSRQRQITTTSIPIASKLKRVIIWDSGVSKTILSQVYSVDHHILIYEISARDTSACYSLSHEPVTSKPHAWALPHG